MKIKQKNIADIKEYKNNPKKHPLNQIQQIANSIKEFGFIQPCVIDKDMNLVIGHGRLQAANKIGMKTVPCVMVENLSKDQVNALRLVDNHLNMNSGWDFEILNIELDEIELDMSKFGFEDTMNMENIDFSPADIEKQPRLDEKSEIKCPHCKMFFIPE